MMSEDRQLSLYNQKEPWKVACKLAIYIEIVLIIFKSRNKMI